MTDAEFAAWMENPESIRCILVEVVANSGGSEVTRYLSNVGYVTSPADTPANVSYNPCISGGVSVSESLPLSGKPSLAWGDIEVANFGGVRDTWLGDIWSGRSISVFVGDVRWPRESFRTVFSGVVEDITSRNADTLNLLLRDKSQRLNTPVTEATLKNDTLTKDTLKPVCFGEVHNITPILIDAATLTYMVHDGPIENVIEVRDNGIPVDFGVNLTNGTFALSASPVGTVTASVQGAKFSGAYANTVGTLVPALATTYGTTPLSAGDIDSSQIAVFAAAHPQAVGLYLPARANLLDTMQQIAASVGAQVVFTPEGKLQIKQVTLPAVGAPVAIGMSDITANSLNVASTPTLQPAVKLGYCKNYTVQSGLTTGLPPAHAELYGQEWLVVQVLDQTTADLWKLDTAPEQVDTLLLTRADAEAEANRRLALWGVRRTVIKYDAQRSSAMHALGAATTLTHSRFGLSGGKTGQIISKKTDWVSQKVSFELLV